MLPMMKRNASFGWMPAIMSEFFNEFPAACEVRSNNPAINVQEDKDGYHLDFAVPGVTKDEASVELTKEGNLLVKIESKKQSEQKSNDGKQWLRREFSYQKYDQLFTLPEDVESDGITASVADGILSILLPKKAEEPQPESRRIAVN